MVRYSSLEVFYRLSFWVGLLALCFFIDSSQLWADEIYVVKKHGTLVYTNRPTSRDRVVSLWKPSRNRVVYNRVAFHRRPLKPSRLAKKLHPLIVDAAAQQGLDPHLVKAVVHAESAFNPQARSHKGAMGLMQLMPYTARSVGVRNPYEPSDNLRGGSRYLAYLLRRYRGNLVLSLAAYNAGPAAVDKHRGVPPYRETREYVHRVISLQHAYRSEAS